MTLLLIAMTLTVVGGIFAFDLWGFASRNYANNKNFTPWGRRITAAGWKFPNMYKVVGWIFFIPGAVILPFAMVALIAGK